MKIGILGQPSAGKTTLWCLLTENHEGPSPAQMGKLQLKTVKVRDERLERIRDDFQPRKYTPATLEIADFPGLPADSADRDRQGLAQLLAPARNMEALILVLRGFESAMVPAPGGKVDPFRDLDEIRTELLLSDFSIVEKRVEKLRLQVKKPTPTQARDRVELELLERVLPHLEAEKPLATFSFTSEEQKMVQGFQFLSLKPLVPVLNRGETPAEPALLERLSEAAGCPVYEVAAGNELEILQLPEEDREVFREEFGIVPGTRNAIISACYAAARQISFFTAGEKEVRAWTIVDGETAVEAAEEIHSDIARGFIRAEVVSYDDYVEHDGIKGAREKGKFRLEGKEYVVKDGDIIEFRHNS